MSNTLFSQTYGKISGKKSQLLNKRLQKNTRKEAKSTLNLPPSNSSAVFGGDAFIFDVFVRNLL